MSVGVRSGDTPPAERRSLVRASARHPHHHPRVAVPHAHVGRRARRCAASRPSSSTRSTRSPAPSGARTSRCRSSGSTSSPQRRRSASGSPPRCGRTRRSRASSAAAAGQHRRAAERQDGSTCGSSVPVDDMTLGEPSPTTSPARARSGRTSRTAILDECSTAPLDDRVRELAPARRAPDGAAQRDLPNAASRSRWRRRGPPRRLPMRAAPGRRPRPGRSARRSPRAPSRARPSAPRLGVARRNARSIEDDLKSGRLRCVVATSSLELGIDMGAVDLVIQVEAPPSVASGPAARRSRRPPGGRGLAGRGLPQAPRRPPPLGRRRRAHGERADRGVRVPAQPARRARAADRRGRRARRVGRRGVVRRSCAARALRDAAALRVRRDARPAGRPLPLRRVRASCGPASCGTATPARSRPAAARSGSPSPAAAPSPTAGCSACSWSARRPSARVGELDEEMVYESRVGDVFALGATSWRIQEITHDRVLVAPAFGEPGRLPFWKGDGIGRPAELGGRSAPSSREIATAPEKPARRLRAPGSTSARQPTCWPTSPSSARRPASCPTTAPRGRAVPRRARRLAHRLHSPYGMRVHAPWALAVGARAAASASASTRTRARATTASCCACPTPPTSRPAPSCSCSSPTSSTQLVTASVGGSALFASRFRECAARALLLPRANPGRRSPLWQQRQRASQLLEVARDFPDFPIVLEAVRECLQDVYDLPALTALAERIGHARCAGRGRPPRRRRPFARACCSATSARSCTRATRRSPSGGPPRCPRPHAAGRAARPGRAARAARPGGGGRGRVELQRLVADRAPRRRGRRRPAPRARPAHGRRGRRTLRRGDGCRGRPRRARRRPGGWPVVRFAGTAWFAAVEDLSRFARCARRADSAWPARGVRRAGP